MLELEELEVTNSVWVFKRPTEFKACARAVRRSLRFIVVIQRDSKRLTV